MSAVTSSHHTDDKPKLLVLELWGLGDLSLATPFLRAAAEKFSVTLLAKPHARELQPRFWPGVKVVPFVAPWTAFRGKYRLAEWPWRELAALRRQLAAERFDFGVSPRHDPRDHLLLELCGVKRRLGFSRLGSAMFLTDPLDLPQSAPHRHECWRVAAKSLGIGLPPRGELEFSGGRAGDTVLVHSGAAQVTRVWMLERYQGIVRRLRERGCAVQVACDAGQANWWRQAGETGVASPQTTAELFTLLDRARIFIGNDSGPGHLAAISGVPTFTVFGPALPELFAPLHPQAEWIEGKPCPFKPCYDSCHFPQPNCLTELSEEEVWTRLQPFIARHLGK